MRPRITKRDRKLHLSYELPHRIHAAEIYPVTAPNGSTVVIYAHDQGVRVLWRGGRRRRQPTARTGARQDQLIDNEEEVEYEDEEDEVDPDCPYPSIIQELDIDTGSSVLHISIPSTHASSLSPTILGRIAVIAIASADGAIRLLQIPLAPPADNQIRNVLDEIVRSQVELSSGGHLATGLALKFLPIENLPLTAGNRHQEDIAGHFLVAATSRGLRIWTTPVTADAIVSEDAILLRKASLQTAIARLSFHPSSRSTQLLLAEHSGAVRTYDPYAVSTPARRPTSSDSVAPAQTVEPGRWVNSFQTSYHAASGDDSSPAFARRKKIIDAKWVLAGKGILVLLEDGQWGLWETNGPTKADRPVEKFAIDGFLGSSNSSEPVEPTKPRKGSSKLAPMTPNTRKTKAEELFKGASKVPGAANLGGISVAVTVSRTGQSDESVVMWYNADTYSITSMQSFWQRSTSSGGSFGSLYSPGLAHITDIDLINESISSIAQFPSKQSHSSTGQMNTQRDLLVTAEHRAIILQSSRSFSTARNLFQLAERPASSRGDVQMADAGDSALDLINAALDNMSNGNAAAKSVGFAH